LLFTIVVHCVDDAKVEQEAGQLLFAAQIIVKVFNKWQERLYEKSAAKTEHVGRY